MSHAQDPEIMNRLRRAHGHLGATLRMLEEGRDALSIAQQLQAVLKALDKAKTEMVLHHIEHHLEEVTGPLPKEARERMASIAEITKYL